LLEDGDDFISDGGMPFLKDITIGPVSFDGSATIIFIFFFDFPSFEDVFFF